jgi:hypothetical protein
MMDGPVLVGFILGLVILFSVPVLIGWALRLIILAVVRRLFGKGAREARRGGAPPLASGTINNLDQRWSNFT